VSSHAFRQAVPDDLPLIAQIINTAYAPAESFLYDGPRIEMRELQQHFSRGLFLLEVDAGTPRGCVFVELNSGAGYLGLLAVQPRHQRRGIAQALVGQAELLCAARGCASIELTVVNHRPQLLSFYASLGYTVVGERAFDEAKLRMRSYFFLLRKTLPPYRTAAQDASPPEPAP